MGEQSPLLFRAPSAQEQPTNRWNRHNPPQRFCKKIRTIDTTPHTFPPMRGYWSQKIGAILADLCTELFGKQVPDG
jgi:hypothetical protein